MSDLIEKVKQGLRNCDWRKTHCNECNYRYEGLCSDNITDCTGDLASDALSVIEGLEAEIEYLTPTWVKTSDYLPPYNLPIYVLRRGVIQSGALKRYVSLDGSSWDYWDLDNVIMSKEEENPTNSAITHWMYRFYPKPPKDDEGK